MSNSQTILENNERINAVTELLRSKAGGTPTEVYDGLDSESTTYALSANQGRVLNEAITTLDNEKANANNTPVLLGSNTFSGSNTFTNGVTVGTAQLNATLTSGLTVGNTQVTTQDNVKKHTEPVLIFDTSTRDTGTYSFLDDINNYNLLVLCGYETVGTSYAYVTTTVDAFKRTESTYQMQVALNSTDKNRYMKLYYKSDTSFVISAVGNFNFRRVYGVK